MAGKKNTETVDPGLNIPAPNLSELNAWHVGQDIEWLIRQLTRRVQDFVNPSEESDSRPIEPMPDFGDIRSPYSDFFNLNKLGDAERAVVALALAPIVRPEMFDFVLMNSGLNSGLLVALGGMRTETSQGIIPTIETALFLIAGNNMALRFDCLTMFDADHFFIRNDIIRLHKKQANDPVTVSSLSLDPELLERMTHGYPSRPHFGTDFPASLIETTLEWEDLILPDATVREVKDILQWLEHSHTIMESWGLKKVLKRGYRVLFFGPPGTGKTLTASMIGRYTGRDVYRIDLSQVVSKYIGETEKNLARVFNRAEHKGWILFFDEADSLFGKRTKTNDAHDRYANQEVSYLLQRVEDYDGVVILASNRKENIDDAFSRRFQSVVNFPMPQPAERLLLWRQIIGERLKLAGDVDLYRIADEYTIAGGAILNVVRHCALQAVQRKEQAVRKADIEEGIRREFRKEGRMI